MSPTKADSLRLAAQISATPCHDDSREFGALLGLTGGLLGFLATLSYGEVTFNSPSIDPIFVFRVALFGSCLSIIFSILTLWTETLAAPVALAAAGFLGSLLGASFVLLLCLIGAWIAIIAAGRGLRTVAPVLQRPELARNSLGTLRTPRSFTSRREDSTN